MRLIELFDRTVDWRWISDDEHPFGGLLQRAAAFTVGDIVYIAGFSPYPLGEPGTWMFGFIANIDGQWAENEIGTGGNELVVFSTVMEIIGEFLQESQPSVLLIGAMPNREGIYTRLLRRREKELNALGYSVEGAEPAQVPVYGSVVLFKLVKE